MTSPCTHDPVIMTERHGRDLRYRAECKYCGMHALSGETPAEAMRDWERMNRPGAEWVELFVPALPFAAAIIILAVVALNR